MTRESRKKQQTRMAEVIRRLADEYPNSECALHHRNPFELLIAVILSAQCTDARVNKATPALFAAYADAESLARAPLDVVQRLISSITYFKAKSKAIIATADILVREHQGEVPRSMEALTALPGVGRKTANVVRQIAFQIPEGVVVDAHVSRLSQLLGFTSNSNPARIEQDLLPLVPVDERILFTLRLLDHGRKICVARRPACVACVLSDICPSAA